MTQKTEKPHGIGSQRAKGIKPSTDNKVKSDPQITKSDRELIRQIAKERSQLMKELADL